MAPEIQEYGLEVASRTQQELKMKKIKGANILRMG
jgi:hypothetical protein